MFINEGSLAEQPVEPKSNRRVYEDCEHKDLNILARTSYVICHRNEHRSHVIVTNVSENIVTVLLGTGSRASYGKGIQLNPGSSLPISGDPMYIGNISVVTGDNASRVAWVECSFSTSPPTDNAPSTTS